jgi:hypothetical protein
MENSFGTNNTANEGKVEEKLQSMGEEKKDEVLSSFETFKSYLGDKVAKGEKLGMKEEQLAMTAQKVADYLADHEEPRNREEKLLQELWKAGNEEEQHKLAHMLVKMVQ